jgi:hypothetical protein
MNVGDIKTRVKRKFGDESGVQVQDDDIIRWINDAQYHIVINNEGLLEKTASIDVVANQMDYTLPTDLLTMRSAQYKPTGNLSYGHMQGYDLTKFDEYINGWDGTQYGPGYPLVYTVYAGVLKMFPIPNIASTAGLKIYYNGRPTDVVTDIDVPSVPIEYHNALVSYCMQQAYELDENFNASQLAANQAQDDIAKNRYKGNWPNQEKYPTITTTADDSW